MAKVQDVIQSAYEDELKGMFPVFVTNLLTEGADSASQKFKDGFEKAKQARDLMLKITAEAGK
jgi:hypothetical protein